MSKLPRAPKLALGSFLSYPDIGVDESVTENASHPLVSDASGAVGETGLMDQINTGRSNTPDNDETGELATNEELATLLSYRTQAELTGPQWATFASNTIGRPVKVSEKRFTSAEVQILLNAIEEVA